MSDRVCIGSCTGPADAAIVRAMLAGHGIASVVTGEQHASVLGGMAGALISLDIWVAGADAEAASALLRELRGEQGEGGGREELAGAERADRVDMDDDVAHDDDDDGDDDDDAPVEIRVERRRRTGVALLLGTCLTFGAAHLYAGAWLRGAALAVLDAWCLREMLLTHSPAAGIVWALAIVVDIVGAAVHIRADTVRTRLPPATLRRP